MDGVGWGGWEIWSSTEDVKGWKCLLSLRVVMPRERS